MSTRAQPRIPAPDRLTIHEPSCRSFQGALELVGRRWTGAILLAGMRGARRFGEYRLSVPGISDRLLAQRLRELEAEGLISRTVIPSTPVQIRYALSPEGEELMSVLQPLVDWSYRRFSGRGDAAAG
ncbi:DNA-binding HxlR family transcriptional regulator [Thermocatellispora tengchongensis]|uniref:DNA-binding HxlR family transcriptional regulator n=1 Tax=Thermocatellispora tengchongensis TaxID=1073253 RepID=A0A840PNC7_9ACTN|nr:helix-turn-helix domain-containing protein [Thermocatellispora tengchongensis]MBB5140386.1 DNA-binding HxlR family transcriptional regulator [Thermocatellispora tengchongensis]